MERFISLTTLCLFFTLLAAAAAGPFPYRPYPYGGIRSYYYSGPPTAAVAPYALAPYAAAPVAAPAPYAASAVLPDYYSYAASAALSYPAGYGYGYGYPYLGAYAGYPYVKK